MNGARGVVVGFESTSAWAQSDRPPNPRVRFLLTGADGRRRNHQMTVFPESWDIKDGDKVRASVTQIPLMLAWALSIHKVLLHLASLSFPDVA